MPTEQELLLWLCSEGPSRHTCLHQRLRCARSSTWQVFHLQMQLQPDETRARAQNKHSTVQFYLQLHALRWSCTFCRFQPLFLESERLNSLLKKKNWKWNLSFIQLHEKQKEEKRKVPPEDNSSTSPFLKVPLWNPKVLNPAHTIT